jgi:hypothetical protein
MHEAKMPSLKALSASFLPSTNLMSYPFDTCGPRETWRMQDFSSAYVRAISAVAGCSVTKPDVDDDSIDLILKRRREGTKIRSQQLDIQLKSTYTDCVKADHIAYPLKIKNYNDLRIINVAVARVLVIVIMNPEAPSARKDDASPSRPLFPPGGLMELTDASLQRGRQG